MTFAWFMESCWSERRREFIVRVSGLDPDVINRVLEAEAAFWLSSPDLMEAVLAAAPDVARRLGVGEHGDAR